MKSLILAVALCVFVGCAHTQAVLVVRAEAVKEDVQPYIGSHDAARASIEYRVETPMRR